VSRVVFNPFNPNKPFDLLEDRWISSFDGNTKIWAEQTIGENTLRFDAGGNADVLKITSTAFVWNDDSDAMSYRFETVGDEHALYNGGANDTWSMGTSLTELTMNGITVKPKLLVDRSGGDSNINFISFSNQDTAAAGAFMLWARARGSTTSPTTLQAVQNGDRGGVFRFDAHDGTQFITGGNFFFSVDNTVSTGIVPTSYTLQLMDASGSLNTVLTIQNTQNVTFSSTAGNNVNIQPGGGLVGNVSSQSLSTSDLRWQGVSGYLNLFRVDASANQVNIGTATQGVTASFRNNLIWFNNTNADIDTRVDTLGKDYTFFINGGADAVGFNTSDPTWIREGQAKPSPFFALKDDSATSTGGSFFLASSTNTRGNDISFGKCAGTWASKTAVALNAVIANLTFVGHDGTDFNQGAQIRATVDGAVSGNTVPMQLMFLTSQTNGGGLLHRQSISSSGIVRFGGTPGAPNITFDPTGAYVFNEQAADVDGRFETSGMVNAFFIDGGTNRIGINTDAPATLLDVQQTSTTAALPVVSITQDDTDEPFMKFIGTAAAADLTRNIVNVADVTTATLAGYVKIEIDDKGNQITDQDYFQPVYTLA